MEGRGGGGPRPIANPLLEAITDLGQSPAVGGGAAVRPSVLFALAAPSRRLRRKGWGQGR